MYKRILLRNMQLKDINPRVCGINRYVPGDRIPSHRIQWHVMHYVTSGKGLYRFNGRELPVGEGDIFVCRPGDVTSYIADEEDPFTYIWVSFDCAPSFAALLERDVFPAAWARPVFEQILKAGTAAAPEWTICARLYDFFAELTASQSGKEKSRDDYVSRAVGFIQANYADTIRIADLAADLGLNRNYFCRLFRQRTGMSPQEYLVSCRLAAAAELLAEQKLSQKEIALRVGYPDVFSFSRMFRRRYGMAPGEYAAQARNRQRP